MSDQEVHAFIGVDPGLTTGTFVFFTDGPRDVGHLSRAEVAPTTHQVFARWADMYGPDRVHVAIERFIITPRTARLSPQPDALEVSGLVKGLAQIHGITDVRQYAKGNLKFASDRVLGACGWRVPNMRHANDAARQAFALLKDVDYPLWVRVAGGAIMQSDDDE